MSGVYTNIARKRIEQSQEATNTPSKATIPNQVDTPQSNAQLSAKADVLPIETKKPQNHKTFYQLLNPLLLG